MDEKINIEMQVIKKEMPLAVGDSEKMTLELFKAGKTIEEIRCVLTDRKWISKNADSPF